MTYSVKEIHYTLQGEGANTGRRQAIQYCLEHPAWKLSIQSHKYLGIA